jgi:hypothetical protein
MSTQEQVDEVLGICGLGRELGARAVALDDRVRTLR